MNFDATIIVLVLFGFLIVRKILGIILKDISDELITEVNENRIERLERTNELFDQYSSYDRVITPEDLYKLTRRSRITSNKKES